jgi:hypothetical protein
MTAAKKSSLTACQTKKCLLIKSRNCPKGFDDVQYQQQSAVHTIGLGDGILTLESLIKLGEGDYRFNSKIYILRYFSAFHRGEITK